MGIHLVEYTKIYSGCRGIMGDVTIQKHEVSISHCSLCVKEMKTDVVPLHSYIALRFLLIAH